MQSVSHIGYQCGSSLISKRVSAGARHIHAADSRAYAECLIGKTYGATSCHWVSTLSETMTSPA